MRITKVLNSFKTSIRNKGNKQYKHNNQHEKIITKSFDNVFEEEMKKYLDKEK